ncbi:MAG: hypothetical protein KAT17_09285 [Candidatus Aminicenantes bacterium]|nr:hypothetical protein [Candidatus Aminicenantes bacterium]
MNVELIRLIGRLGNQVSPKLIYFFLSYQIIITLMTLLLDSGLPSVIMIAGWIILFLVILIRLISTSRIEQREEKASQNRQSQMMKHISRIKRYLSQDHGFQTRCSTCKNFIVDSQTCKENVPSWANPFKFHIRDSQTYCLYWGSKNEPESSPPKFRVF